MKPVLHWHVRDPSLFVQIACVWQPPLLDVHSSTSEKLDDDSNQCHMDYNLTNYNQLARYKKVSNQGIYGLSHLCQ